MHDNENPKKIKVPPSKKLYRCKHCKVPVLGEHDYRAVLGKVHAKRCPRNKL